MKMGCEDEKGSIFKSDMVAHNNILFRLCTVIKKNKSGN